MVKHLRQCCHHLANVLPLCEKYFWEIFLPHSSNTVIILVKILSLWGLGIKAWNNFLFLFFNITFNLDALFFYTQGKKWAIYLLHDDHKIILFSMCVINAAKALTLYSMTSTFFIVEKVLSRQARSLSWMSGQHCTRKA